MNRIEERHIDANSAAALAKAGVPDELARTWGSPAGVQDRTVVLAWQDDTLRAAAFTSSRPLTAYLKIGATWTHPESGPEAAEHLRRQLVGAIEERAWKRGLVSVKIQYHPSDPTAASDQAAGYTPWHTPQMATPLPSASDHVPTGQVRWRTEPNLRPFPYVRQTTEFTCGPAALSMGLAGQGLIDSPSRQLEIDMWRQATSVGGHGGCDPYGLAVAAHHQQAYADVWLSTEDTILTEDVSTDADRDLKAFVQQDLRAAAKNAGHHVTAWFAIDELRTIVDSGKAAIVLIDEDQMHTESCPHWILVHAYHDGAFIAHDPWTDSHLGESWLDGYNLPIRPEALERLAQFGDPPYRSMVVLHV
ncbi:peptidase C39 family protein [Segeticoccus rhizosphaerae]|uniref:peptidase C39 family protein n=1 Tax=Segeticoccus rhizosphaerae TaxID=1104777 RepID=UPI0013904AF8|nr:peptidase C39 family protein [Ornithinicoccus soli]